MKGGKRLQEEGKRHTGKCVIVLYGLLFVLLFVLTVPLSPMYDDWYYLTSPNPGFGLGDLLPTETFWRPFDAMIGGFLGLFPGLFPYLNHLLVIFAHIMNGVLLNTIMKQLDVKQPWRVFSVCFFLLSSATWAITLSPDAFNQAYSLLFGLWAVSLHLKKRGYRYLLLSTVALFWKESGVSWFFVIPLFEIIFRRESWKDFIRDKKQVQAFVKEILLSLAVIGLYFAARFFLLGRVSLGGDGRIYKLSILSVSFLKNGLLLFASAATGVDSVALFGNPVLLPLAGLTIVLSLLLAIALAVALVKMLRGGRDVFLISCLVLGLLCLAFPLMILGSAGEMHAYPLVFGMAVLYGLCFDRAAYSWKQLGIPVAAIFLAFGISSVHKLISIYDFSDRTKAMSAQLQELYEYCESPSLFVVEAQEGYSIFSQPGIVGACYGLCLRPEYDWKELPQDHYRAKSTEDAHQYLQAHMAEYEQVFLVQGETVERIK